MYLVIVDTTQIQSYIFGSNRLRENIGASHLVAEATERWALEAVQAVTGQHNNIMQDGELDGRKHIEESTADLHAEVIYAGGGNFVVVFGDEKHAKDFARRLSRKALEEAPNLQLVVTHQPFGWVNSLSEKVKFTFEALATKKRTRSASVPLLGLGVTVMCQSTGLPAAGVTPQIGGDPGYPASAEILAKHRALKEANRRLQDVFGTVLGDRYEFPSDFDQLGRTTDDHSYIAVVHADGNGMAQRVRDIGCAYPAASQNRDYIDALRCFSSQLNTSAQVAFIRVLELLVTRLRQDGGASLVHRNAAGNVLAQIDLKQKCDNDRHYLPFRPLVFGGDDVTFVCDGRIGLSLAIEYLQQFEMLTANLPDGKGSATACAGVSIVKTHYPFARAYTLAEELCGKAKEYRRAIKQSGEKWDGSCLDWHLSRSGLAGGITEIRQREYNVEYGSLTIRPVTLEAVPGHLRRSWQVVQKGIRAFQDLPPDTKPNEQPKWSVRRNKIKALRDALRGGPDSVEHFLLQFNEGKPLPYVGPSMTNWRNRGWLGGLCGYFDAIELVDWFIPLRKGEDG